MKIAVCIIFFKENLLLSSVGTLKCSEKGDGPHHRRCRASAQPLERTQLRVETNRDLSRGYWFGLSKQCFSA